MGGRDQKTVLRYGLGQIEPTLEYALYVHIRFECHVFLVLYDIATCLPLGWNWSMLHDKLFLSTGAQAQTSNVVDVVLREV